MAGKFQLCKSPEQPAWCGKCKVTEYLITNGIRSITMYRPEPNLHGKTFRETRHGAHLLTAIFKS